ncbi:hypothetical protein EON65_29560 [archaeon]|nr:MAG: hypothetical protein EON65_29560 [archaeon]
MRLCIIFTLTPQSACPPPPRSSPSFWWRAPTTSCSGTLRGSSCQVVGSSADYLRSSSPHSMLTYSPRRFVYVYDVCEYYMCLLCIRVNVCMWIFG